MSTNTAAYTQAYREANLGRIREQNAANQRAARARKRAAGQPTRTDADRARDRAYYTVHAERIKARVAAWRRGDLRRTFANFANVKAKKLGIEGRLDWRELPELPRPCTYCGGVALGFDHVIPMGRGGANTVANLAPACLPCNQQKNARLPDEYQALLERLAA